jgi:hypothetical protein
MHGSQEALGMLSPMDGAADKLLKGDLGGAGNEAMLEAFGGRVFKAAGKGMAAVKRHAGQLDEAVGALSHADDAATATATGVRESIEEASSVLAKEGGGVAKTPAAVPQAGEDLFVGLYGQTRRANIKSGLNATHTPHHVVQNAVSETSHSLGVTINMRKDLHALTRTFGTNADRGSNMLNLAADVRDLRNIFRNADYDRSLVNQQMQRLIELNRQVGNVP